MGSLLQSVALPLLSLTTIGSCMYFVSGSLKRHKCEFKNGKGLLKYDVAAVVIFGKMFALVCLLNMAGVFENDNLSAFLARTLHNRKYAAICLLSVVGVLFVDGLAH